MKVHLVDGTYELFRAFYGPPSATAPDGREVGATRGLLRTLYALLGEPDVTHVACAFDSVVESFRNEMFAGYKTGEGMDPSLYAQFSLAERAVAALGIVVWPMVEFEADDALAAGAARFAAERSVDQVVLCSADKDLAQCVRADRVVCLDRLRGRVMDEAGVVEKFGVRPSSIPDWLALVGDVADGIPGIPRWGPKSSSTLLAQYGTAAAIPDEASAWAVRVRGADSLAQNLRERRAEVELYRELATLRTDVPLEETLDDLEWRGARFRDLSELCAEIGDKSFCGRIRSWREDG